MEKMQRRHRCIWAAHLKRAISDYSPVLRSEKLPEFKKFFVDIDLLKNYFTNDNQLIVGRRGTGKTHLLGTIDEIVNKQPGNQNISIFISLTDIYTSPTKTLSETREFYCTRFARLLFNKFLESFAEILFKIVYRKFIESYRLPKSKISKAESNLIKIYECITDGAFSFSKMDRVENSGRIDSSIDISKLKQLLRDLIDLLEIEMLYVLIDEWMQIDKTARLDIQPYFAELLKKLFFGEQKIAVKIASIWHETNLYDRKSVSTSRGLQIGDDIAFGTDLDSAFIMERSAMYKFFEELLFKRLSDKVERLKGFQVNDKIEDQFIVGIFDNKDNFEELILASHGIPRDFLQIFNKCSKMINYDFANKCINKEVIGKVVQEIFLTQKRKNLDKASPAFHLFKKINSYLDTTHNRFFLVENKEAKNSISLRKLSDERLIHPIPSACVSRQVRDLFKCYAINYGNYIDWYNSLEKKDQFAMSRSLLPRISKEEYNDYIISIEEHEETTTVCPICTFVFSKMEKSYALKKLCPHCFEKISFS